jgi:hypothetical protein
MRVFFSSSINLEICFFGNVQFEKHGILIVHNFRYNGNSEVTMKELQELSEPNQAQPISSFTYHTDIFAAR